MAISRLEKIRAWAKRHRRGLRASRDLLTAMVCAAGAALFWTAGLSALSQIPSIGAQIGVSTLFFIIFGWFIRGFFNAMGGPRFEDYIADELDALKDEIEEIKEKMDHE